MLYYIIFNAKYTLIAHLKNSPICEFQLGVLLLYTMKNSYVRFFSFLNVFRAKHQMPFFVQGLRDSKKIK